VISYEAARVGSGIGQLSRETFGHGARSGGRAQPMPFSAKQAPSAPGRTSRSG
jgi:hypothetical protein